MSLPVFCFQSVPSYGTGKPHSSGSVNVPMTEIHPSTDSMFEATGDSAAERHAHTVYYNICQVWQEVGGACASEPTSEEKEKKTHPSVGKMGILRSGNLWSDDSVSMSWFRAPPTAYRHDDITSTITDICTKGLWVTVVSWMKWTEMDLNRIC